MQEVVYHTNYKLENNYWWFTARNGIIYNYILNNAKLPLKSNILDVGCGTGGFVSKIAEKYNVICLDSSPIALDYCKKRGLELRYNMYLQDFPKSEYKIDAITILDVVEHVDDDYDILKTAYNILEDGGKIFLTVPAYMWMWSQHDEVHQHKRRHTKKQINDLLKKTGFEIDYSTYFDTFLFLPAVLKRVLDKIFKVKKKETEPVEQVPNFLNVLFSKIFKAENIFIKRNLKFPFGVSIFTVARKRIC